jgi:hypothetical protein
MVEPAATEVLNSFFLTHYNNDFRISLGKLSRQFLMLFSEQIKNLKQIQAIKS